jgi:hypothetical protein
MSIQMLLLARRSHPTHGINITSGLTLQGIDFFREYFCNEFRLPVKRQSRVHRRGHGQRSVRQNRFAGLTLATLWTASGLFIASLVYLVEFRVRTVSDALFVAVVIAVSVSVLLLVFGFRALFWGCKFAKGLARRRRHRAEEPDHRAAGGSIRGKRWLPR